MKIRPLLFLIALSTVLAQNLPRPQSPPLPQNPPNQPNRPVQPAQPGPGLPGPGQGFGALKAYLSVTDQQIDQFRRVMDQARNQSQERARALEPQMREKKARLDELVAKGNDPAAIGKAVLEVRDLERQIHESQDAARRKWLEALSPDQKARFKAVEDAALLPAAAREAVQIGLVPGLPSPGPLPQPVAQPQVPGGPMGPGPRAMIRRNQQGNPGPRPAWCPCPQP